jgi:hypothetical protein
MVYISLPLYLHDAAQCTVGELQALQNWNRHSGILGKRHLELVSTDNYLRSFTSHCMSHCGVWLTNPLLPLSSHTNEEMTVRLYLLHASR